MQKIFIIAIISLTSIIVLCKTVFAGEENSTLENWKLGGYTSVGVVIPRNNTAEVALNEISLILSWENDSRFKFFGEFEIEHPLIWNDRQGLTTRDAYVDLERLYLDYNLSEKLNLRAGRFLTPAGRWNLLHAAPLVWTSTRPLATSRLFPSSINGLMLYGSVPWYDHAFEYTFFAEALKDQIKDNNEIMYKNVGGARFSLNNSFNPGLTLMAFTEDVPGEPDYRMVGLDFTKRIGAWELSGEAFQRLTSKNNNGGSGAYLQSAYPLGSDWHLLTRLEVLDRPDTGSAERWLVGATKRLKPNQLFKLEFVGGSGENPDSPRGFISSFAVLF